MIKTEQRIADFKKQGVKFIDSLPDGWTEIKYATTAPNGYKWVYSPKDGKRALLKI